MTLESTSEKRERMELQQPTLLLSTLLLIPLGAQQIRAKMPSCANASIEVGCIILVVEMLYHCGCECVCEPTWGIIARKL